MLNTPVCFCCGAALTAPTMINGRMYGYSCAAKIEGGAKARKYKMVPVSIVKEHKSPKGHVWAVNVKGEDGKVTRVSCDNTGSIPCSIEENGVLYLEVKR